MSAEEVAFLELGDGGGVLEEGVVLESGGRRCEEACTERSMATRSEESFAALTASVRGMMRSDWANSPIASCSLEP